MCHQTWLARSRHSNIDNIIYCNPLIASLNMKIFQKGNGPKRHDEDVSSKPGQIENSPPSPGGLFLCLIDGENQCSSMCLFINFRLNCNKSTK